MNINNEMISDEDLDSVTGGGLFGNVLSKALNWVGNSPSRHAAVQAAIFLTPWPRIGSFVSNLKFW